MDRHLGLDLEAGGEAGEGLHIAAREHPVAGEQIAEAGAEHLRQEAGQHGVAEPVAGPIGGLGLAFAAAHHHVELLAHQHLDHLRRGGGLVGRVAVHQHIDVGVHVREHPAHHMALAGAGLAADHRARLGRHLGGAIAGAVVEDIDPRVRQGGAEVGHHLADGAGLVQAGDQDGDAQRTGGGGPRGDPFGDLLDPRVHVHPPHKAQTALTPSR